MANLMENINNINAVKKDLSELPSDPREKSYIDSSISPIADLLYKLSSAASSLAESANYLSQSFITKPKKRKIRKTNDTIYEINEACNELFKIIKERIDLIE
ncbi:MAG: hypothetical protein WCQ54_07935 [Clostridiaceae bacterium]